MRHMPGGTRAHNGGSKNSHQMLACENRRAADSIHYKKKNHEAIGTAVLQHALERTTI